MYIFILSLSEQKKFVNFFKSFNHFFNIYFPSEQFLISKGGINKKYWDDNDISLHFFLNLES